MAIAPVIAALSACGYARAPIAWALHFCPSPFSPALAPSW